MTVFITYITVFVEFLKTGLFAIGGGLATLPFLYDIADKYDWFTRADLSNMIAVSESTPGPIGVNCATYAGVNALGGVGFVHGLFGGVISTLGLVIPSVIVVLCIAKVLDKFQNNRFVQSAFYGIRPAVAALIAIAFVDVFQTAMQLDLGWFNVGGSIMGLFSIPALILFGILVFATNKLKWHPIIFIAFSAVAGIIFKF